MLSSTYLKVELYGGRTTHNDTTNAQIAIVHFALTHAQGIANGRNATENNGDDGTVMRTYPALAGVVKLTKTKTVKYPGKAFTSFVSLRPQRSVTAGIKSKQ
uniref:Uncharacterized protein n=1 Tax=Glossina pallidipes TaxID=7398 RepID=A0A1A9ZRG8_GLOPL